jgi:peroxiredoxin
MLNAHSGERILSGLHAPGFSLPNLEGQPISLKDLRNQIVIINFWSAECPTVARVDPLASKLWQKWGKRVILLRIASNANESQEILKQTALERGFSPVLVDHGHAVADLYGAQITPLFFILDKQGIVRYQGAFDGLTFRQQTATRFYLEEAVEAVLAGKESELKYTLSTGCEMTQLYRPVK